MPPKMMPTTPIDAYKAIIDQLVQEESQSIGERLLRELGLYSKSKSPEAAAGNELARSLTPEQHVVLGQMLRQERISAIHDVLAVLTWWRLCHSVGLTFHGQPMPIDLSGMGLHGDYIGRLNNWQWPEDAELGKA
jgi:hypothetical protein